MDIVDIVRVSLVVANTSLFGYLILTGLRERSDNRGPGVLLMRRAALAAYGAVFIGGLQRIILQGVPLGLVNDDALGPILETYAYVQAAVVLSLGVICWRSFTLATHRLRASDDLLAAFGGSLPDVDWPGVHLTPREREVLGQLASGCIRDAQLAEKLHISPETARSHVKAITRKTGLNSRLELAVAFHSNDAHL